MHVFVIPALTHFSCVSVVLFTQLEDRVYFLLIQGWSGVTMPPTGAWYSIWATERDDYDSPELLLDCLLPTGIIVQLKHVSKDATLVDIKTVIIGVNKLQVFSVC